MVLIVAFSDLVNNERCTRLLRVGMLPLLTPLLCSPAQSVPGSQSTVTPFLWQACEYAVSASQ